MFFGRALDSLDERDECRIPKGSTITQLRHRFPTHEIAMLDGAHTRLQASLHTFIGVDMSHCVGTACLSFFDDCRQLVFRVSVPRDVSLGRKHDTARSKNLDLRDSFPQLLSRRLAHLANA